MLEQRTVESEDVMNCIETQKQILEMRSLHPALESHLQKCSTCRDFANFAHLLHERSIVHEPPAELDETVKMTAHSELVALRNGKEAESQKALLMFRRHPLFWALAASFLFCIGLVWLAVQHTQQQRSEVTIIPTVEQDQIQQWQAEDMEMSLAALEAELALNFYVAESQAEVGTRIQDAISELEMDIILEQEILFN